MFSRRQLIKTMGLGIGAAALTPIVQNLKLQAAGEYSKIPKRFVFVVCSNGLKSHSIQPLNLKKYIQSQGGKSKNLDSFRNNKFIDHKLNKTKLHNTMKSLEPFKDQTNIIRGLSSGICSGSHSGEYGILGSYTSPINTPPRQETFDGTLSKIFPGIFPHLGFEMANNIDTMITYPKISALGKNKNIPFYANPMMAYKDLFGTVLTGGKLKSEFDINKNILDFLVGDVKRAKKDLVYSEKEKLDHYLNGFEALRDRQAKLSGMGKILKKTAPELDDKYNSKVETHRLEAHFDMTAAALIAGLTQVVTLKTDNLAARLSGLNLEEKTVHHIGHLSDYPHQNTNLKSGMNGLQAREKIVGFHMDLIAGLASKLKAVPEGDGTMLDNTLIVYLSDAGDRHHSNFFELPFVTVGNIGKKFKTGRYMHYPYYNLSGHRTMANFYLSILHAVGKPRDNYGDKDLKLKSMIDQDGPLSEL